MKIAVLFLCASLASLAALHAADITLTNGRVLKNATMIETETDSVRIRHDDGVAKVSADQLPNNLREEWGMTPDQVAVRVQTQKEKEQTEKEQAARKAKELRDSMSESEKIPRYIQPAELFGLLSALGEIHPAESKYLALKWNRSEAARVGLSEQAQEFDKQIAAITPQINSLAEARQKDMEQWQDMTRKMEQLAQQSQQKTDTLSKQVSQLQNDLNNARIWDNNRTIIYRTPVYYNNWSRGVYYRPVPPAPRPVPIIRRIDLKPGSLSRPPSPRPSFSPPSRPVHPSVSPPPVSRPGVSIRR